MSAALSFQIKECFQSLSRDSRWNVLTVLMLHTNVRNRCFVGMDRIAKLATNGNLTKATAAKKWLESHGAFEKVPFSKRIGDELNCPPRQHIYQLTGKLEQCCASECDCRTWKKSKYEYWHVQNIDVLDGKNNDVLTIQNNTDSASLPNVLTIQNNEVLNGNVFNGQNVSNPTLSKRMTTDVLQSHPIWQAFIAGYPDTKPRIEARSISVVQNAISILQSGIDKGDYSLLDITGVVRWQLSKVRTKKYFITYVDADMPDYKANQRALAQSGSPTTPEAHRAPDALRRQYEEVINGS